MCKFLHVTFVFLLVFATCALSAIAQSQASTGQIIGTVKNPAGELVPGATVTVTNPATGLSRSLTTNDQGGFSAVNLPSGDYTIDVEAPGFGRFTQTGYKVEVGSALTAGSRGGVARRRAAGRGSGAAASAARRVRVMGLRGRAAIARVVTSRRPR